MQLIIFNIEIGALRFINLIKTFHKKFIVIKELLISHIIVI